MAQGHALLVDAFGVRGEQLVREAAGTGDEGVRGDGHGSDSPGAAGRGAGGRDVSFLREEHGRAEDATARRTSRRTSRSAEGRNVLFTEGFAPGQGVSGRRRTAIRGADAGS
ncbi:hypothetical protein GCM10009564_33960 [Streptomyces thermogriseus]|uniref:Uncharacterized protein n=1 Tax=Streptomyces thermogriseus TaxID=75292 RepID=A0ABN1T1R0_9ACTN